MDTPILTTVLERYGLAPDEMKTAGGTAGRTWRVTCARRNYFVRCRGARTSAPQRIAFDHGLRRHLAEKGFCAYPPLPARDGATYATAGGGAYEVYPWVDGIVFTGDMAERVRVPTARTLAAFHAAAGSYTATCEELVPQFGHYPVDIAPCPRFDDPEAFLAAVDYLMEKYGTPENHAAMSAARRRVEWLAASYGDALYGRLPKFVIHGDYNCFNLLFAPSGEVAGVFDFDWAWRDVRVRDIGEGMFFFGTQRDAPSDPGSIWSLTACPRFASETMVEFLRAYHEVSPLSADECRAVPLAMLGRWVACRTEGVMKVPEERRAEFFLLDFERPFEWFDRDGDAFVRALIG